ncbi:MAG TPA: fused MFS/spermidine synthase [Thermoanaerobaculia bacterium]|nr:fused MFS/spermidine synthase [Thermoanaerobaculia bacterium]
MNTIRAAIVVFIASFCTLVIELVAGRLLAPYVGVSLYTWTSIIGVVLAGISAGAYAGGWLADRRPLDSTLAWLLLASGATSLLIAPATSLLAADDGWLTTLGLATTLVQRVVILSFLLFFLPCFFLGMISPVAVKLAVRDLDSAGRVVGRIYAVSTLGSIAGTFTTGFYLIARFGTRATLIGTGIALIVTALFVLLGRRGRAVIAALVAMAAIFAIFDREPLLPPHREALIEQDPLHVDESQYYTIQVERTVREDNGAPLLALRLDHLLHSHTDLADPLHLEYGYLRLFNEVVAEAIRRHPSPRFLFIGGGGYTLPRRIAREHPEAEIDVVEIDAAVTRAAYRFLDAPREARTINEDARWFAMRAHDRYDAIFIDAFNDLSVPYHLTTREFASRLRELLEPDGALVANVVDDFERGRFLASYARTLQSVFGEPNVAVVMETEADMNSTRSTFVVAASANLLRFEQAHVLRDPRYLERGIVLTDDFAPVDNMLAPLFTERFVDEETE